MNPATPLRLCGYAIILAVPLNRPGIRSSGLRTVECMLTAIDASARPWRLLPGMLLCLAMLSVARVLREGAVLMDPANRYRKASGKISGKTVDNIYGVNA